MNIVKERNNDILNVTLEGRLDTNTAPDLESEFVDKLQNIKEFILDLKDLDYISSAGLRVILTFHKQMTSQEGKFSILNPKDEVMEIFDMTGFSTFLDIKE